MIISHRSPLQEEDCRLDRLGFVGVAPRAKRQGSDRRAAVTPMVSGAGIATRGLHGRPTRAGGAIALGFTSTEAGTANDLPVTRITRGLLGVCRELTEGNRGLLGAHRKLESLPRVRQSSLKMIGSLPECTRGRR
ncbi:hypothetical protein BHE74_00020394 [Ensete ventricosum]|nr:hypothetical protein BHE74_00020394 [Ensete ventricosum]RZR98734.1 hypothetical protein BHM03_00028153 [Ensete ventricosum]